MSREWGIFNEEGLLERGFWGPDAEHNARVILAAEYAEEEDGQVAELCPEHDEERSWDCSVCNAEED